MNSVFSVWVGDQPEYSGKARLVVGNYTSLWLGVMVECESADLVGSHVLCYYSELKAVVDPPDSKFFAAAARALASAGELAAT